jgi:2-keto-4-pentenoate hydratase/2-oxohepta-3-ene-1,7-dioic acid hydratase in catechol pathway
VRLATYTWQGQRFVGQLSADQKTVQAFDVPPAAVETGVLCLIDIIAAGQQLPAASGTHVPLTEVSLRAPMPRPRRNIFCVGRNYREHAKELSETVFKTANSDVAEWPIVFTKVPECVVSTGSDVVLPLSVSSKIDYEAELAVIIGKGGRNITAAQAMSHVIVNDVTARDVQMRHQQWDLGKSFDTFCPMGPSIVTSDVFDGQDTRVRCWVNGELRQDGSTRDLIFDIPTLIATCSRGITLYPGDIIATGTPAGVGMGLQPPRYLAPGDVVRIEIDGLGHIENKFVAGE